MRIRYLGIFRFRIRIILWLVNLREVIRNIKMWRILLYSTDVMAISKPYLISENIFLISCPDKDLPFVSDEDINILVSIISFLYSHIYFI